MSSRGLYRAKPVTGGEMVKGWYFEITDEGKVHGFIVTGDSFLSKKKTVDVWEELNDFVEVIPSTVGQATGKTSDVGNVIYQGDICCALDIADEIEIIWDDHTDSFCGKYTSDELEGVVQEVPMQYLQGAKVIGTIHDKEPEDV